MNNAFTLTPLFRRTVGFDRFNDLFESALRNPDSVDNYPPYNIEKTGDDEYRIVMAVAGFSGKDISIVTHRSELKVIGKIEDKGDGGIEYLHRGIATRAFERTFSLADHVKVVEADLRAGLLSIRLVREVPEDAKPKVIAINGVTKPEVLDA
jgi:molecular chaperone IbpA